MTRIIDLPTEVLTEILCECDKPSVLAQTCKQFSSIAYSTLQLWTTVGLFQHHFTPDGPFHLRAKLLRARGALLCVAIVVKAYTDDATALFKTLAEHNAQLCILYLTAPTAMGWRCYAGHLSYRGDIPSPRDPFRTLNARVT